MFWSSDRLLILKDCAPQSNLESKTLKHGFDNVSGKGKFISVQVKKLYKRNRDIDRPILSSALYGGGFLDIQTHNAFCKIWAYCASRWPVSLRALTAETQV